MGRVQWVRAVVKPWAAMCVVVSAAALVPLFILIMGRGLLLNTAIVFAATVWYVVLTMSEASRSVPAALINVARSFGASRMQIFRSVLLPALHPFIQIAARIGLTHALRGIVTAEMFVSSGYGGLLNNAGLDLSTAGLFSLIVVLMVASTSATGLLRWLARKWAPWYYSKTQQH
jgi:ABC-type nitrate/sulfonate/bicarbonate transport system permease component